MPSSPDNGEPTQSRREWSDIQQGDYNRSTTTVARKRKWSHIRRMTALIGLAVCVCGALVYASYSASKDKASLEPSSSALAKVTFRTDGVLNDKWLAKTLSIKEGTAMTSLDIAKIRKLLESNGQIRSATVSLHLPNELVIEVRERMPILRAQAQVTPGVVKTLLISGDGEIYEGANYPVNTIRALPFVDGVVFTRRGDSLQPLNDMEPIANFLNAARMGWPRFYRDWTIVSLKRYRGGDSLMSVVEISSHTMGKLVFSIRDVEDQFRRLSQALAAGAAEDSRPIVGVNLSIPGQVIVDYAGVVPAATAPQPVYTPMTLAKPSAPKSASKPGSKPASKPVSKPATNKPARGR
jgi:hypothetical protein